METRTLPWREREPDGPVHALQVVGMHEHRGQTYFGKATTTCGIEVPEGFDFDPDDVITCPACRDGVLDGALEEAELIVADAFRLVPAGANPYR